MAAFALINFKSALGAYIRRQRARLGAAKAITATAHKLARLVYIMLNKGLSLSMSVRNTTKNDIGHESCRT
jgi:hypothetical protein